MSSIEISAARSLDRSVRSPLIRYLPHVGMATMIVAGLPIATVWELRGAGFVTSPWLCMALAMGLSLGASSAGCAYWKRRKGSDDLLFSELLIWGWLWRWRAERQLGNAVHLLGLMQEGGDDPLLKPSVPRQERLLRRLASALEAEDRYTRGHSDRVARHATRIARRMGLPRSEVAAVRAAALIHDVGKLRVPIEILNKPGKLTDAEFEIVKRHPTEGAEMVAGLHNDELTAIVRHHHERLDGRGYPDGLSGDSIPLGARIVAVADTFDAITSVRPYRPGARHKKALDIIANESGRQLDPAAVSAFLSCYSGRRPIAIWSTIAAAPERTFSWLSGETTAAATVTTGKMLAAAAATLAVGGASMTPAAVTSRHSDGRQASDQTSAQIVERAVKPSGRTVRIFATTRQGAHARLHSAVRRGSHPAGTSRAVTVQNSGVGASGATGGSAPAASGVGTSHKSGGAGPAVSSPSPASTPVHATSPAPVSFSAPAPAPTSAATPAPAPATGGSQGNNGGGHGNNGGGHGNNGGGHGNNGGSNNGNGSGDGNSQGQGDRNSQASGKSQAGDKSQAGGD